MPVMVWMPEQAGLWARRECVKVWWGRSYTLEKGKLGDGEGRWDRRSFSLDFEEALSWGRQKVPCLVQKRTWAGRAHLSSRRKHCHDLWQHDNCLRLLSCVTSTTCQAFDTSTVLMSSLPGSGPLRCIVKFHCQGDFCAKVWLHFVFLPMLV